MKVHSLSGNVLLYVYNYDDADACINNVQAGSKLILSASRSIEKNINRLKHILPSILIRGVMSVIIIGEFSEEYHDLVDEIIDEIFVRENRVDMLNIVTTFHGSEDLGVVFDVYIDGVDKEQNASSVIYIYDENVAEDRGLKSFLTAR